MMKLCDLREESGTALADRSLFPRLLIGGGGDGSSTRDMRSLDRW
jgi:hypothetical protein